MSKSGDDTSVLYKGKEKKQEVLDDQDMVLKMVSAYEQAASKR